MGLTKGKNVCQHQEKKFIQDLTDSGAFSLTLSEKWWKDQYFFLKDHGYLLRPRYHPEWIPTWLKTNANPIDCEDSCRSFTKPVMDATRISDNAMVAIKRVSPRSSEVRISKILSSDAGPYNHCVPILEHIHDDARPEIDFLVMPLLRAFDSPPFHAISEVIDFIEQTLQGLVFLHEKNVAHRDCSDLNIMMDAKALYPKGFHPIRQDLTPSFQEKAEARRRYEVHSLKYYFVDYGISVNFPSKEERLKVLGIDGLDREPPELRFGNTVPYDPFMLDIFILGNVYKKKFVQVYDDMDFLEPLTTQMTQKSPEKRPTALEALEMFKSIKEKCHERFQSQPLRGKSKSICAIILSSIMSLFRSLHPRKEKTRKGKSTKSEKGKQVELKSTEKKEAIREMSEKEDHIITKTEKYTEKGKDASVQAANKKGIADTSSQRKRWMWGTKVKKSNMVTREA